MNFQTHKQSVSNFLQDVGQAVLESYSRVLEGLAFNIVAWIEDVFFVDRTMRNQDGQRDCEEGDIYLNPKPAQHSFKDRTISFFLFLFTLKFFLFDK